ETQDTFQSFVNFLPSNIQTGGFCCIPGSHHQALELWRDLDQHGDLWSSKSPNFLRFAHRHKELQRIVEKSQGWWRVCPGPGQVVIWYSRLVHSNVAPLELDPRNRASLLRLVSYVSCGALLSEGADVSSTMDVPSMIDFMIKQVRGRHLF